MLERWTYNREPWLSFVLVLIGVLFEIPLVLDWLSHQGESIELHRESVLGVGLGLLGVQMFGFTLLLQIVAGPAYSPPAQERAS